MDWSLERLTCPTVVATRTGTVGYRLCARIDLQNEPSVLVGEGRGNAVGKDVPGGTVPSSIDITNYRASQALARELHGAYGSLRSLVIELPASRVSTVEGGKFDTSSSLFMVARIYLPLLDRCSHGSLIVLTWVNDEFGISSAEHARALQLIRNITAARESSVSIADVSVVVPALNVRCHHEWDSLSEIVAKEVFHLIVQADLQTADAVEIVPVVDSYRCSVCRA